MRVRSVLVMVGLLSFSSLAQAEDAPGWAGAKPGGADEGTQGAHPRWHRGSHSFGVRGTFGRALTEGVANGWYGRLEMDGFFSREPGSAGFVGGSTIGFEGWGAEESGGGALPTSLYVGFRSRPLFASLGIGANALMIDSVKGDTGVGIFAPFAGASLGLELPGLRVLADARAIYRWQWAAPDRPQLQVGITLEPFFEQAGPRQRPVAKH